MLFYCHTISPRLQYMLNFIGRELFDSAFRITTNEETFRQSTEPRINYSEHKFTGQEFFIHHTSILFEKDIRQQEINCIRFREHKAFFETTGDFPFDIFAASFYLMSRYEEYLPHEKDEYGRYAYFQSLAYREGFLQQPLVNIWLEAFKEALLKKFPQLEFRNRHFKCALSYDIDIAYSLKYKGFVRTLGGFIRSVMNGKPSQIKERWRVITGKQRDPYDCFEWLDALHLYCRVKPYFFFLVAGSPSRYDKNNSTDIPAFQDLITYYTISYKTGLHPSWQSGDDPSLLTEEKTWLETIASRPVTHTRQHYIRFNLPETFRLLIKAGLQKDFSMGYGSINGFRASVCSSFPWYDLEANKETELLLYPFCFMDANSYYEQKDSPQQAYAELLHYYETVKRLKGIFIPIWHNSILGTAPEFEGWRQMFELFMKETVFWDAYND